MNKLLFKKYIRSISAISVFIFLTSCDLAQASIISVVAQQPSTVVGKRISVDVLLDPQNQSINSIESNIIFPRDLLDFSGFSNKQSSVSIWVEEPREKEKGLIHFSGVIPGGIERLYDPLNNKNTSIPIVRLFFTPKKAGLVNFDIKDSLVLQNDGKGTPSQITSKSFSVQINQGNSEEKEPSILGDKTSPNPFAITIIERSIFGKTPRLAVFSADDDNGAIEHYEVAIGNSGFHRAISPFPLPYKLFSYTLTVRAYDYSGNIREQQTTVLGDKPYGLGLGILALVLIFIFYRLYSKVKKYEVIK